MKRSRLLSILLVLTLLLSALVSCSPEQVPEGSTEVTEITEAGSSEDSTVEAPTSSEFVLVQSGKAMMKIVRPANLTNGNASVETAIDLRKLINNTTKVSLTLGDDWIAKGKEYDSSTFEILIGNTPKRLSQRLRRRRRE